MTDYQACGINPANLGWHAEFEDKKITFGFTELTFSLHSEALTKEELRTEVRNSIEGQTTQNWTYAQKQEAAKSFANFGLGLNMDMGSFGFSFAHSVRSIILQSKNFTTTTKIQNPLHLRSYFS